MVSPVPIEVILLLQGHGRDTVLPLWIVTIGYTTRGILKHSRLLELQSP